MLAEVFGRNKEAVCAAFWQQIEHDVTKFGHLILPWMNGQDIGTLVAAFVAKKNYSPSLFQVPASCLAAACVRARARVRFPCASARLCRAARIFAACSAGPRHDKQGLVFPLWSGEE